MVRPTIKLQPEDNVISNKELDNGNPLTPQ